MHASHLVLISRPQVSYDVSDVVSRSHLVLRQVYREVPNSPFLRGLYDVSHAKNVSADVHAAYDKRYLSPYAVRYTCLLVCSEKRLVIDELAQAGDGNYYVHVFKALDSGLGHVHSRLITKANMHPDTLASEYPEPRLCRRDSSAYCRICAAFPMKAGQVDAAMPTIRQGGVIRNSTDRGRRIARASFSIRVRTFHECLLHIAWRYSSRFLDASLTFRTLSFSACLLQATDELRVPLHRRCTTTAPRNNSFDWTDRPTDLSIFRGRDARMPPTPGSSPVPFLAQLSPCPSQHDFLCVCHQRAVSLAAHCSSFSAFSPARVHTTARTTRLVETR